MNNFSSIFVALLFLSQSTFAQDPIPGFLANSGFDNMPIASVLFYSGNWRNEIQFYDFNPTDNLGLYTLHPSDARHLGWSEDQANRDFAVQAMIDAGVNVINMSYWGLPGTDNWAWWAPMQSSTESHDELFSTVLGMDILIAPFIESFAATDDHEGYFFSDDFPGTAEEPAPRLLAMIEDLIHRYLLQPGHPEWPDKWARVYDKNGLPRYLISIVHVASNQESVTDEQFAAGFDLVADKVFVNTGIHIGFALDILPVNTNAPGTFKATAEYTGAWLHQQESVLAIQCYLPEIWTGMSNENALIDWKRDIHQSWINTGIPFIHDLTASYDAQIVFPGSPVIGNTQSWRDLQSQAIHDLGSESLTYNSWNGYTLGMAGMPTLQHGNANYLWLCHHFGGNCSNSTEERKGMARNDQLEILPNPVNSFVNVRLKNSNDPILFYEIIDSKGIMRKAVNLKQNAAQGNFIHIPLEDIPPGLYFLNVKTGRSSYCEKLLKIDAQIK